MTPTASKHFRSRKNFKGVQTQLVNFTDKNLRTRESRVTWLVLAEPRLESKVCLLAVNHFTPMWNFDARETERNKRKLVFGKKMTSSLTAGFVYLCPVSQFTLETRPKMEKVGVRGAPPALQLRPGITCCLQTDNQCCSTPTTPGPELLLQHRDECAWCRPGHPSRLYLVCGRCPCEDHCPALVSSVKGKALYYYQIRPRIQYSVWSMISKCSGNIGNDGTKWSQPVHTSIMSIKWRVLKTIV